MKSNKLNLKDMWRLYLLLKPAIAERDRKDTIEDEVLEIIKLSDPKALLECIHILYDNEVNIQHVNEFVDLVSTGLEKNNFFLFVETLRGIDGNN